MIITPHLFEAYLRCRSKCWLRATAEPATGNVYAEWCRARNEAYRVAGTKQLLSPALKGECTISPSMESLKTGKWRLAIDVRARTQNLESRLHAVERVPSEGRGKPARFVPIRFVFTNKLHKDDKLLLAFGALILSELLGREISLGRIIHGDGGATQKVRTSALASEVRKSIEEVASLSSNPSPPDLVLNRHCAECEFQARCRRKALEEDDLSLLSGMTEKERKKLHNKGIFTVTQLSYTFRPRRRPKRLRGKREKYHHSLHALAIREKKIHIIGRPELKIEGTPVYLDVEGLPDRDSYYLIGVRIGNGESAVQHSLWADSVDDEKRIWGEFLSLLSTVENPVLIHYGSYETTFLTRMSERYGSAPEGSAAAKAASSTINLVSVIFGQIYFPTFSNSLKEVAGWLGFNWSDGLSSGLNAICWRERWANSGNPLEKQRLICYNTQDCEALSLVTQTVLGLNLQPDSETASGQGVVDASSLRRQHPYGFKRNAFFFPELDSINRAAYWDYQRERVYLKSNHRLRRALRRPSHGTGRIRPNRRVQCARPSRCPHCQSPDIEKHTKHNKIVHDLKFTTGGIKRWIVRYEFHRFKCLNCGKTFFPRERQWSREKFGSAILLFAVYQNIELCLPAGIVDKSLNKLYGLQLSSGSTERFKTKAAEIYKETYELLLTKLRSGSLIHADETKISVRESDGFVWVFANMEAVAYVYTETREAEMVQTFLRDFKGVLVSDFFAAYGGIDCPQQKCLIHLIRDLNDALYEHPYDEDLKRVVQGFANLVKPMVETVDRFGLKSRFLKKHLSSVDTFYKGLSHMSPASEVALKCKERFEKNRDQLFTFLQHDGVPWNNNNAEHAVKAFAKLRNVIKGVTSSKGLRNYLVLLSISESCKYMGVDFLDFLRSGEKDLHAFAQLRTAGRFRGCSAGRRDE